MIETDQLLFERRESVASITFNRPEARNAMTWEMYNALYECCEAVEADNDIRVLVLRGAGAKAFVAGTDIKQFLEFESGEDGIAYEKRMERVIGRLEAVRKPTVAGIDGYAIGGGPEHSRRERPAHLHPGSEIRDAHSPNFGKLPLHRELRAPHGAHRAGAHEGPHLHCPDVLCRGGAGGGPRDGDRGARGTGWTGERVVRGA